MFRRQFNAHVIRRCIELLKSQNDEEIYESVILAAYLIEQSLKTAVRYINPLLYFEIAGIPPERTAQLVSGKLLLEDLLKQKTIAAQKLIQIMCELKNELKPSQENFIELFHLRNIILHATDDFPTADTAAETAASAIDAARSYILDCAAFSKEEFNPLTSREFLALQKKKRDDRVKLLMLKLDYHRSKSKKLSDAEIKDKITRNKPLEDGESWIENTDTCPACGEAAFDEIVSVGFDVSDGMVTADAGSSWLCRVCELDLSPYEINLIEENAKS